MEEKNLNGQMNIWNSQSTEQSQNSTKIEQENVDFRVLTTKGYFLDNQAYSQSYFQLKLSPYFCFSSDFTRNWSAGALLAKTKDTKPREILE